jgi:predicted DNA-binding helix-hairpin-helix protein
MTFNGVYQPTWAVNREDYQTALFTNADLTTAWSVGMRQTKQFNIQSKENMVISTNWIPESYVTYLGQLFMSEAITFAYNGIYYGVNCTDVNMERKRVTNAKLIQYTLNLEYSQPYINKIVR